MVTVLSSLAAIGLRKRGNILPGIFLMVLVWEITSSCYRFMSVGMKLIMMSSGAEIMTCRCFFIFCFIRLDMYHISMCVYMHTKLFLSAFKFIGLSEPNPSTIAWECSREKLKK